MLVIPANTVEFEKSANTLLAAAEGPTEYPMIMNLERYSSWGKLIRVSAYVLRAIECMRGNKCNGFLTSQELKNATMVWLRHLQRTEFPDTLKLIQKGKRNDLANKLGLFMDENEIMRCKGRLENANIPQWSKFPVLIPKHGIITTLLIEECHKRLMHGGASHTLMLLRTEYWVPQGRVQRILKQCNVCRKAEGDPFKMPRLAPLPRDRLTTSCAFSYTGLDYFGPMYVKQSGVTTKVWVCLFTCLTNRAVHLELVDDMTAAAFMLALRRFVSRRGTPNTSTTRCTLYSEPAFHSRGVRVESIVTFSNYCNSLNTWSILTIEICICKRKLSAGDRNNRRSDAITGC